MDLYLPIDYSLFVVFEGVLDAGRGCGRVPDVSKHQEFKIVGCAVAVDDRELSEDKGVGFVVIYIFRLLII